MKNKKEVKEPIWTDEDEAGLAKMDGMNMPVKEIAKILGRTDASVESKLYRMKKSNYRIPESPFPVFDNPLRSSGDALILPDFEAPFHHADFINRAIDLADSWKIKTVHLAGDLLHYESLSRWGANWVGSNNNALDEINEFILSMKDGEARDRGIELLQKIEGFSKQQDFSAELKAARQTFSAISSFDDIVVILGNHDDRYIKSLDKKVDSKELLHQIGVSNDSRWRIAPYYYSFIDTDKGVFRITHQRASGANVALDLCAQFHTHVLCAHTHRWSKQKDRSGKLWAILMGHCVDENRLAYVMQRDARRDSHALGAVIIRDGFPFTLDENTPFSAMKKM